MIRLSRLNKLIFFITFFLVLNINLGFAEDKAEDIWKKKDEKKQESNDGIKGKEQEEITIENSIFSGDIEKVIIKID